MARRTQFLAALDFSMMDSHQIDRRTLTAMDCLDAAIVVLQASNPNGYATRFNHQLVADLTLATADTPGNHRTMTGNRKCTVDRHPKWTVNTPQPLACCNLRRCVIQS